MNEKIVDIVKKVLEKEKEVVIKEDTDLSEMGMTSISMITLILCIEEELNVEFEDDDLLFENLNTIHKIIRCVEKYVIK